jgi:hypothetical protein
VSANRPKRRNELGPAFISPEDVAELSKSIVRLEVDRLDQEDSVRGDAPEVADAGAGRPLNVMCWDGTRWWLDPLEAAMSVTASEGYVEIVNTSSHHRFARLVHPVELDHEFKSEIELSGDVLDIALVASDGDDRSLGVDPMGEGVDLKQPQAFRIQRSADDFIALVGGAGNLASSNMTKPNGGFTFQRISRSLSKEAKRFGSIPGASKSRETRRTNLAPNRQ